MPADPKETSAPLAEISNGPSAFESFLDRNQKNLIILSILLALGAAALVVYRGIEDSRQQTAGEALSKAADLAALQSVVSDHPGTHAAQSAMLLLADKQWSAGQQTEAIATLNKFIAESPEHPAVPTAKGSLGSKLMAQGKSGDAAKNFEEIVDNPSARYIAPYALISMGDVAMAAGDLDKAEAAYKRVKTDFSESSFATEAGKRIANLKAKPPVEIAPPPKPAEPEKPADPTAAIKAALPPGVTVTPADPAPANPGITVTPSEPPASDSPAPPAADAPATAPPQDAPAPGGNESKPEEKPAAPQQ
jgi:predicted negative regulator of RcsB-dependent stress response